MSLIFRDSLIISAQIIKLYKKRLILTVGINKIAGGIFGTTLSAFQSEAR